MPTNTKTAVQMAVRISQLWEEQYGPQFRLMTPLQPCAGALPVLKRPQSSHNHRDSGASHSPLETAAWASAPVLDAPQSATCAALQLLLHHPGSNGSSSSSGQVKMGLATARHAAARHGCQPDNLAHSSTAAVITHQTQTYCHHFDLGLVWHTAKDVKQTSANSSGVSQAHL